MRVKLFPEGNIHSAYLDMVKHPPEDIEYVGEFNHSQGSSFDIKNKKIIVKALDIFKMPFIFNVDGSEVDMIHSCQKLLLTDSDFVIDIEHGNPFMGAYSIDKHKYLIFRKIVSKILEKDNCKAILPWSIRAMTAFTYNFGFLGKNVLEDKTRVVYPAVEYIGLSNRFDKFTFIFVAGESFYAKGGLQVLEAFDFLKKNYKDDFDLIVVGNIPKDILIKYPEDIKEKLGLQIYAPLNRKTLLELIERCHCLLLPSHGDTFGITALEAKARGVPAIMADSFSATEIVQHNSTGYIILPDNNVNQWFDIYGRKRMNKTQFHSQFKHYKPDSMHVLQLALNMLNMMNGNNAFRMGKRCLEEIDSGKFSIKARNSMLKEVYER